MSDKQQHIRDEILIRALPDVAFDGWTGDVLARAAQAAGHDAAMARAVFPDGVGQALDHFSDYLDRQMLERLSNIDVEALRIRDRVKQAVMARLEAMAPWREAEKQALAWRSLPLRTGRGVRALWKTADKIWVWAGDTATDYNRYTKRALLSGVIAATILAWLDDKNEGRDSIEAFLERRIDNVLRVGGFFGKMTRRKAS